jgi:glycosyltransferase involved in cell wall biosynthesis
MTISVITPSLNQSDWLRLCVASVADQGGGGEHIIQDAGSTDGTLEWLRGDGRVCLFAESDGGMYDAVNRGLQKATGEVAAYLNCDEQYLPGVLPRVSRFFESHPEVDVLFGNVIYVNENGDYLAHRKMQVPRLYHTWVCHLSTLTCAMFFRRRLVTERGVLFDPSYRCNGDAEWMVRLLKAGVKMAVLGGVYFGVHLHGK